MVVVGGGDIKRSIFVCLCAEGIEIGLERVGEVEAEEESSDMLLAESGGISKPISFCSRRE